MRALITAIFFVSASPSWAAEVTITDGDTLVLNGTPHRLDGIYAPETDQVCLNETGAVWTCGIEARDQLKERPWPTQTARAPLLRMEPGPSMGPCPDPVRDTSSTTDAEPLLASRRTFRPSTR